MDKKERKKILRELKEKKKVAFEKSLPIERILFGQLFDFLDERLESQGCNHTLDGTLVFLANHGIPQNDVVEWLNEYGGYCDCEVLANVEEKFWDDAIL